MARTYTKMGDKPYPEPEFQEGHMTDDAKEGYRQYLRWRDRRKMGVVSYSVPGTPLKKKTSRIARLRQPKIK